MLLFCSLLVALTPEPVVQSVVVPSAIDVSLDDKWIAIGGAQLAQIWDVAATKIYRNFPGHPAPIANVALSRDRLTLATGTQAVQGHNGEVSLFDTRTGQLRARFGDFASGVGSLAFDGKGDRVFVGLGAITKVFEVRTQMELLACLGSDGVVSDAWNAFIAVHIGKLRVCDLKTQSQGPTLQAPEPLALVTADTSGSVVVAAGDHAIWLWRNRAIPPQKLADVDGARSLRIVSGKLRVRTTTAFVWIDLKTGARESEIKQPLAEDTRVVEGAGFVVTNLRQSTTLTLYSTTTGAWLRSLTGFTAREQRFALSADGRWLLTTDGLLWDLHYAKIKLALPTKGEPLFIGNQWIVQADETETRILDLATLAVVHRYPGGKIALSQDQGMLVIGAEGDGPFSVLVVDPKTWGAARRVTLGKIGHLSSLTLSPDGKIVITGNYGLMGFADVGARAFNLQTGAFIRKLSDHTFSTGPTDVSSDERYFAASGWGRSPMVYRGYSGHTLVALSGHTGTIKDVRFNRQKPTMLASASEDGRAIVWDVEQKRALATLDCGAAVERVRFSDDGKRLFAATADGSIHVFDAVTLKPQAVLLGLSVDYALALNAAQQYRATKNALTLVGFRLGDRVYPFEQFDLKLNRPHEVVRALGGPDPVVRLYPPVSA